MCTRGSNPPTLIPPALVLAACLLALPLSAEDAAFENVRAAAEALAAGKGDEAAAHCGKLLTFDLAPATWMDVHYALLCLRPPDIQKLLSRVERRPWMGEEDLTRMTDLARKANREPEKAAEVLVERLKASPDDAVLLNLLGCAREGMGQAEEAEKLYEQARKAAGKAVCFWVNMPQVSLAMMRRAAKRHDDAYLLEQEAVSWLTPLPDPREALAKGDLEEAVRAIRDVAYYRTQLAMALSNVGYYQGQHQQWNAAADSARKSLAIEPRDGKTWANLAVAQDATGDLRGALESIERAMRLEPDNEIYEKEREIILSKLGGGGK